MLFKHLRRAFFMGLLIISASQARAQTVVNPFEQLPPEASQADGAACAIPGSPCGCPVPPDSINFSPEIDGLLFKNIRLQPVPNSAPYYKLLTTLINRADHPYRLTSIESPLGHDIVFTSMVKDGENSAPREEIRKPPFNLMIAKGAILPLEANDDQYLTIKASSEVEIENSSIPLIFHFADHQDITVTVPVFSEKGLEAFRAKIGPDGQCEY